MFKLSETKAEEELLQMNNYTGTLAYYKHNKFYFYHYYYYYYYTNTESKLNVGTANQTAALYLLPRRINGYLFHTVIVFFLDSMSSDLFYCQKSVTASS